MLVNKTCIKCGHDFFSLGKLICANCKHKKIREEEKERESKRKLRERIERARIKKLRLVKTFLDHVSEKNPELANRISRNMVS